MSGGPNVLRLTAVLIVLAMAGGPRPALCGDDADAVGVQRSAAVVAAVDELVELPGYEIRRVYLEQLLAREDLTQSDRRSLRGALEVLDAASAGSAAVSRERLRSLLTLGTSTEPADRELALHAARTGADVAAPGLDEPAPAEGQNAGSSKGDWLDNVASGLGPIEWSATRQEVIARLKGRVEWQPIHQWTGPRYPLETGFVQFDSSIGDCPGEFTLFLTAGGFRRYWFTSSEPRCWLLLRERIESQRGQPEALTLDDNGGDTRVLTWEGRVPIKLAVEGDETTSLFLSVEAPPTLQIADASETRAGYPETVGRDHAVATKGRDRIERGRRMRTGGAISGAVGVVFLLGSIGTGVASQLIPTYGDTTNQWALIGLSVGTGLTGGTLLTIGVAQGIHGGMLIRRGQKNLGAASHELRLRLAPGEAAISFHW